MQEVIIHPITAVACTYKGKIYSLPPPYRHSDVLTAIKLSNPDMGPYIGEQGFLDKDGFFVTRQEGFKLTAGTEFYISKTLHPTGLLFSEDVWATPGVWGAPEDTEEWLDRRYLEYRCNA